MNADEIVKRLREYAEWCDANEYEVPLCMGDNQRAAADLIESLQAQLDEYKAIGFTPLGVRELQKVSIANCQDNADLRAQLSTSQRREKAARNELCLKCGLYHDAHNGACDGCRWKEKAR